MNYFSLIFFICTMFLMGCDSESQYDVYVLNKTDTTLQVAFKSMKDQSGVVEKTIFLKPSERRKIISTVFFNSGQGNGTSEKDCHLVATYVTASQDGKKSSKEWCSDAVEYTREDVSQGSFTLNYTDADFQ